MTYFEYLTKVRRMLETEHIDDAAVDAEYLMEQVTGLSRARLLLERDSEMPANLAEEYMLLAKRRAEHEPLQHIIGFQEFMGLDFKVSPDVLIPRQDTEILVEETLKLLKPQDRVLDICTGSGCIAISVKKHSKVEINVSAGDISTAALMIAKENAEKLAAKVHFFESDLFESIPDVFDIITANPPYIPSGEIKSLEPEVCEHDPLLALDGGEDGLWFYRRIADGAKRKLVPGGYLCQEIGCEQAEDLRRILSEAGYSDIRVVRDLAGLDRVVIARYGKG